MCLQQRFADTSAAARQHGLHHGFLQRFGYQLNALFLLQAIAQNFKALLQRAHITKRRPLVRRKGLGHKAVDRNNQLTLVAYSIHFGAHAFNHLHRFDDILVLFSRQADHIIQLDVAHTSSSRQFDRIINVLLRNALVNRSAHPLAACLRRYGHRALAALCQCMGNLLREHIGTHAGHGKRYLVLH